jgi:hypothetical protein
LGGDPQVRAARHNIATMLAIVLFMGLLQAVVFGRHASRSRSVGQMSDESPEVLGCASME